LNTILDQLESWNVKDSMLHVSIATVKNSADYADSVRTFSNALSERLSYPLFRVSEVSRLDRIFASEINWARLDAVWEADVVTETSKPRLYEKLLELDYASTRNFNEKLGLALRSRTGADAIPGLDAKLLRVVNVLGSEELESLPRASHVFIAHQQANDGSHGFDLREQSFKR